MSVVIRFVHIPGPDNGIQSCPGYFYALKRMFSYISYDF